MVALDQMDGGGLDPKFVAGLLASADPGKKETASWIIGRHPNWASELAGVLGERLARIDLSLAERTDLEASWAGLHRQLRSSNFWQPASAMPSLFRPHAGAVCRRWPGRT